MKLDCPAGTVPDPTALRSTIVDFVAAADANTGLVASDITLEIDQAACKVDVTIKNSAVDDANAILAALLDKGFIAQVSKDMGVEFTVEEQPTIAQSDLVCPDKSLGKYQKQTEHVWWADSEDGDWSTPKSWKGGDPAKGAKVSLLPIRPTQSPPPTRPLTCSIHLPGTQSLIYPSAREPPPPPHPKLRHELLGPDPEPQSTPINPGDHG